MYGINLDRSECDSEEFYHLMDQFKGSPFESEKMNVKEGITFVDDVHEDEYHCLGHVLVKSDNHDGFDHAVSVWLPKQQKEQIRKLLSDILGRQVEKKECGFWVISNYR